MMEMATSAMLKQGGQINTKLQTTLKRIETQVIRTNI